MNKYEKVTNTIIESNDAGQRLDNYLFKILKGVPKSRVYKAIRKGEVRLNAGRCQATSKLITGDKLRLPPFYTREATQHAISRQQIEQLKAAVLFENEDMLVLNKPAGLASQGGTGLGASTIDIVREFGEGYRHCALVHRLDKPTSGCMVIAKNRETCSQLQQQWQDDQVQKHYWVVIDGEWPSDGDSIDIDAPLLRHDQAQGHKVTVDAAGKDAHTRFTLIEQLPSASIVKATLFTGRLHQIRAHTAHLGKPIWGDDKYGDFALNRDLARGGIKRLCLHAWELSFNDPNGGKKMTFTADVDKDLYRLVSELASPNPEE